MQNLLQRYAAPPSWLKKHFETWFLSAYYITKPSMVAAGIPRKDTVVSSTEAFGQNTNLAVLALSRIKNLILNIQGIVFASSWSLLDGMKNGDSAKIV